MRPFFRLLLLCSLALHAESVYTTFDVEGRVDGFGVQCQGTEKQKTEKRSHRRNSFGS